MTGHVLSNRDPTSILHESVQMPVRHGYNSLQRKYAKMKSYPDQIVLIISITRTPPTNPFPSKIGSTMICNSKLGRLQKGSDKFIQVVSIISHNINALRFGAEFLQGNYGQEIGLI